MLVPVGLATLSLRELLRTGWEIEAAPWYVLAWYAFDSFIKLHYTSDPDQQQNSNNSDKPNGHITEEQRLSLN
jgi:hypothetical protein